MRVFWPFILIMLLAMVLGGCSWATTSDSMKQGYGPAREATKQGQSTIEVDGVDEVLVGPDGSVTLRTQKGGK